MLKSEREQVNEIRQVLDDVIVRVDIAATQLKGDENLAQALKALLNFRNKLMNLEIRSHLKQVKRMNKSTGRIGFEKS